MHLMCMRRIYQQSDILLRMEQLDIDQIRLTRLCNRLIQLYIIGRAYLLLPTLLRAAKGEHEWGVWQQGSNGRQGFSDTIDVLYLLIEIHPPLDKIGAQKPQLRCFLLQSLQISAYHGDTDFRDARANSYALDG
ncbi:hypothetical protein D1872_240490 [compost metagenome]